MSISAAGVVGLAHGVGVIGSALNSLAKDQGRMSETSSNENSGGGKSKERTSKDPLRRDSHGDAKPDSEAVGTDHTQLGTKTGRNGNYRQGRTFDKNNNPVEDIDLTNHGRKDHPNIHKHRYIDNPTGGSKQRGGAEPIQ